MACLGFEAFCAEARSSKGAPREPVPPSFAVALTYQTLALASAGANARALSSTSAKILPCAIGPGGYDVAANTARSRMYR